jgi:hypothetical protein
LHRQKRAHGCARPPRRATKSLKLRDKKIHDMGVDDS